MKSFNWKRIVVKVGSALIAPNNTGCSPHHLLSIARFIVHCRAQGVQVVLVSSGSVAAGAHQFAQGEKRDIALKKAMAATGQTEMMATWDKLFDFPSAQILLTHGDLRDRERYESIRATIFSLLEHDVLPIINENDTVTTDNLKVGDNDNLSAMVATAADADALIMCSDIDGLFTSNPNLDKNAKLLSDVAEINDDIYAMAGGATSGVGTGGMRTKIEAAEKAVSHGISTFIINGFNEQVFNELLAGRNPGTHFHSHKTPMQENVHWMKHTSTEQGELIVDSTFDMPNEDEVEQITGDEIIQVKGNFSIGDTILLRKNDGTKIAKARTNYSSCLLNYIAENETGPTTAQYIKKTGPIVSDENIAILEK
ncbi:glutamate 5-kinase [Flocculibacter collagenilyticus]|uniref:glutamate 5-kinase n=1 Tax=Flocculibacter collagenilyticus TaxID=2744479 RepID=UPI0018F7B831|nr:glutamate 5-kinase [Flocculibacter collagenilyticus]